MLALCLAAVPFAFGTLRSGGMGKRLFIGIVFALGFWLLQQQFVRLAQVYHFDYRLAYLLPTLVMLGVSWCCSGAGRAKSRDSCIPADCGAHVCAASGARPSATG